LDHLTTPPEEQRSRAEETQKRRGDEGGTSQEREGEGIVRGRSVR
jgi:hypothetical protein